MLPRNAKNSNMIDAIIVALNAVLTLCWLLMFWVTAKNNGVFPSGSITIKYKKKVWINISSIHFSSIVTWINSANIKTNNKLSFDKNRIKNVRVTSNESKVIYIATEDITDILSDIEGELEQVFGGDWMLDKSRNRLFSSNKIYIFTKKEQ